MPRTSRILIERDLRAAPGPKAGWKTTYRQTDRALRAGAAALSLPTDRQTDLPKAQKQCSLSKHLRDERGRSQQESQSGACSPQYANHRVHDPQRLLILLAPTFTTPMATVSASATPPLSRSARVNYSNMDSATSPSAPRRMTR